MRITRRQLRQIIKEETARATARTSTEASGDERLEQPLRNLLKALKRSGYEISGGDNFLSVHGQGASPELRGGATIKASSKDGSHIKIEIRLSQD